MSFFRKMVKFLSDDDYRRNPDGSSLTEERLAALSVGAINSEQTCYYCDSLATGEKDYEIRDNLEEYYGVTDSQTAEETLEWLLHEGHRIYYDAVMALAAGENIPGLDAWDEEEKDRLREYFSNLQESFQVLIEEDFLEEDTDLGELSILAWDMGRLVMVTRSCYDCGYIDEAVAWKYIEQALKLCREAYGSWQELAQGYVVGRAMWGGNNSTLLGIIAIAQGLLDDEESPWKQVPLQGGAK